MPESSRNRRLLIIVNPRSGKRKGVAIADGLRPVFESNRISTTVLQTMSAGQAAEIARSTELRSWDACCVVGGDGTVHEFVNALMQRTDDVSLPLCLIPAGTSNALHKEIGCSEPAAAVQWMLSHTISEIDVAEVTTPTGTVYCLHLIGWGAAADINRAAERLRWVGSFRYALATLKHLVCPLHRRLRLVIGGEVIECTALFLLACNTRSAGAHMLVAPHAKLDDGRLDVVLYRGGSFLQMLTVFRRVFRGTHPGLPGLEYRQASSFLLESDDTGVLNLDGESKAACPITVTVHRRALRVFGRIQESAE